MATDVEAILTVIEALFNETHPNREQVSRPTVSKTLRRFNEIGNVRNCHRTGRPKNVLQQSIISRLTETFPNYANPNLPAESIWFQQGETPPLVRRQVRHDWNETFPGYDEGEQLSGQLRHQISPHLTFSVGLCKKSSLC